MPRRLIILGVTLAAIVLGAALVAYELQSGTHPSCSLVNNPHAGKYQAQVIRFSAVTEYCLDSPSRFSNGIALSSDGSVWFGEQSLPGVGHLFPNGTVTEFPWPAAQGAQVSTGVRASIWSLAIWNGLVWAADGDSNQLLGVDLSNGSVKTVATLGAHFPYLLAGSPSGDLWFTSLSAPAKIGKVGPDFKATILNVSGLGHQEPIQVGFVNKTFGYLVALDPYNSVDSGLYSFNPHASNSTVAATKLGGNFTLVYPQALSVSHDEVWVAQHLPSMIAAFDSAKGAWTTYPTSRVDYVNTTLPYFVQSTGADVWFNEHYGNRIALLDQAGGKLTEYSESEPPVSKAADIQNDLTIAAGPTGAWFTSVTGNYVGFVSRTFDPGYSIGTQGSNKGTVAPGGTFNVQFSLSGSWTDALAVKASDSENYKAIPQLITIQPDKSAIGAGSGPTTIDVAISADPKLPPGEYTVALTVGDGMVFQSAYLFLTVT